MSKLEATLVRALLIAEWNSGFFADSGGVMVHHHSGAATLLDPFCPACRERNGRHGVPCPIDAALILADLPDQASRNAARAAIRMGRNP